MTSMMSRNSMTLASNWEMMDFEEPSSLVLDDVGGCDSFLMPFTSAATASDSADVTLGLSDESESDYNEELPSFFYENHSRPMESHRVTPDSTKSTMKARCTKRRSQLNFKKLVKSMRQSDATRSIIKRQNTVLRSGSECDFFSSPRCSELEASRRALFEVLSSCN